MGDINSNLHSPGQLQARAAPGDKFDPRGPNGRCAREYYVEETASGEKIYTPKQQYAPNPQVEYEQQGDGSYLYPIRYVPKGTRPANPPRQ